MKRTAALLLCLMMLLMASCSGAEKKPEQRGNDTGLNTALNTLARIPDTSPRVIPKAPAVPAEKGKPFIPEAHYPEDDLPVCIYNVRDFGAVGDGKTNDNMAIANAITAARKAGGGCVYLPAGVYECRGCIIVPNGVTLCGDWASPDEEPAGKRGTVLLAHFGRGDKDAHPFITLGWSSGVRNLTIYYPEQKPGDIQPYPPTFHQPSGTMFTLENVTVVNPWTLVLNGDRGGTGMHFIKNVYASPLSLGIQFDEVYDIGRLEKVRLSPKYWQENLIDPMTDEEKDDAADYLYSNARGIRMLRSDWEYTYDVRLEGLNCGIEFAKSAHGSSNAQLSQIRIRDCDTGILLSAGNRVGVALTNSSVIADRRTCLSAISGSENFDGVLQLNDVEISGGFAAPVVCKGRGTATFVNCRAGAPAADGNYTFDFEKGSLSLMQTALTGKDRHVRAGEHAAAVSLLGCTLSGEGDFAIHEKMGTFLRDDTPLHLAYPTADGHQYRKYLPLPSSRDLYNVADYGAKQGDPDFDSTAPIQKALDDAGKTGGVVFIPAGEYYVYGNLRVPEGVELAGIFTTPTHSGHYGSYGDTSKGGILSVLYAFAGRNDENAEPFITLEQNSGVRGLHIWYPEQDATDPVPYPWTVQSRGPGCWAVYTDFINSYNALDFGTYPSDNHYVQYCAGSPLRRGIFAGSNASNGWIENCHFNPHYIWNLGYKNSPRDDAFHGIWDAELKQAQAFIFGYNASEHVMGTFVYGASQGLTFIEQDGKATSATIIGHGTDGARNSLTIEQAEVLQFINSQLVAMQSPEYKTHADVKESFTGTAAFFNSLVWGPTDDSFCINGGNVIVQQTNFADYGRNPVIMNGGNADITGCCVPKSIQVFKILENAGTVRICGNVYSKPNPRRHYTEMDVSVKVENGEKTQVFSNWYR